MKQNKSILKNKFNKREEGERTREIVMRENIIS